MSAPPRSGWFATKDWYIAHAKFQERCRVAIEHIDNTRAGQSRPGRDGAYIESTTDKPVSKAMRLHQGMGRILAELESFEPREQVSMMMCLNELVGQNP